MAEPPPKDLQANLRFRFADGKTETQSFEGNAKLGEVFEAVETLCGRDFQLSVAHPRQTFSASQREETLWDLGLVPSQVLIVDKAAPPPEPRPRVVPPQNDSLSFAKVASAVVSYIRSWWDWFNAKPQDAAAEPLPAPAESQQPQTRSAGRSAGGGFRRMTDLIETESESKRKRNEYYGGGSTVTAGPADDDKDE